MNTDDVLATLEVGTFIKRNLKNHVEIVHARFRKSTNSG